MPMIYQVTVENETENELTQKILFVLGYDWGSPRDNSELVFTDDGSDIIQAWTDMEITHGSYWGDELTFEEFLDKLEEKL